MNTSNPANPSPAGTQVPEQSQQQGALRLFEEGRFQDSNAVNTPEAVDRASEGWSAPDKIGTDMERPKRFPLECLGALRDVVVAISDKTGVSTATTAATVLSAASLLAQMDYSTKTLGNDSPLTLFFLVLVPSGRRKSSTFELSFRTHIRSDEDLVRRHTAAVNDSNKHRKGHENGDAAPLAPRLESPHALQTNMTVAAALRALQGGRPSQCLANSDAGSSMSNWSARGAQSAEMFQTLALLWDGTSYAHARGGSSGSTYHLSGQTLSIVWMAQPDFAEWLFSEKGKQGLSARFLTSSNDEWEAPIITDAQIEALVAAEAENDGNPPVPPALQRYWEVIATERQRQDIGMEYRSDSPDGGRRPTLVIGRTPEAYRFLLQYGRECDLKAEEQENPHSAHFWRRAPEHACRVAAVMLAWRLYQDDVRSGTHKGAAVPPGSMRPTWRELQRSSTGMATK